MKRKEAKRRAQAVTSIESSPARRPPVLLDLVGLTILTLIAYSNSLSGGFVFDDQVFVLNDAALAKVHTLADAFSNASGWRRLLFLSYGLNRYWNGLDPFGYHLLNVILHATNVVLVYFIIRLLARPPGATPPDARFAALAGAAVFAVHPLFTGAVSYISGRSSVLCGLFYFAAVLFFLKGPRWFALAAVSALLAWQAKQEAIALPVFLAGLLWLRSPRRNWRVIAGLSAVPLIAAVLLRDEIRALYANVGGNRSLVAGGFETVLEPAAYLRTYITSIAGYYLPRFVFPVSLNADPHIRPVEHWYSPAFLLSGLLLVGLAVLALRWAQQKPLLAAGLAAMFLSPLTVYGVMPLADIVLEYRAYIPGLGIALLSAWAVMQVPQRTRWWAAALVVVVLAGMTINRNSVFANNITLWEDVVAKSPDKPRSHFNLGSAYQDARRTDDAIREYERSLALKPDLYAAYSNIAAMQIDSGRLAEAEKTLLRVTRQAPDYSQGFTNLSVIYLRRQETDKSIAAAEQALALNSEDVGARFNLAEALTQKRDFKAALEHYRKVVQLRPDLEALHLSLALAYARAGDFAAAERELLPATNSPNAVATHVQMANIYSAAGNYGTAIGHFQQALRLKPDFSAARHDLGVAYMRNQQMDQAIEEFTALLKQQPDNGSAVLNLALAYQTKGRAAEARAALQEYINRFGGTGSSYVVLARQRLSSLR
jgi:tetratricopeptide (TPR) repeat protein